MTDRTNEERIRFAATQTQIVLLVGGTPGQVITPPADTTHLTLFNPKRKQQRAKIKRLSKTNGIPSQSN